MQVKKGLQTEYNVVTLRQNKSDVRVLKMKLEQFPLINTMSSI